jgi:hypothetical protein
MFDGFDTFYEQIKGQLISDVIAKVDIKSSSLSQRKSLLDNFFSRLDAETTKIMTSDAYN